MATRMNNFTGKEWLQNSFTIWHDIKKTSEERKLKHPALFPQQLVEKIINIYTKDPGEVILDPFLGIGSTVIGAYNLGKKGIGVDLSSDFIKITKQRIKNFQPKLLNNDKPIKPKIILGNSKNLDKWIKPESVDLVITSPPYWDILNMTRTVDKRKNKNYSDNSEDLGNIHDYNKFLTELKKVYAEVYKTLKPNKRCVSVVMDIRKKDKFFPLHIDQSRIMSEIGFELEEFVIWDRASEYNNMKTLGYPWVFRFNKVHEYICIYWKR